jgi:hypothetical protein
MYNAPVLTGYVPLPERQSDAWSGLIIGRALETATLRRICGKSSLAVVASSDSSGARQMMLLLRVERYLICRISLCPSAYLSLRGGTHSLLVLAF